MGTRGPLPKPARLRAVTGRRRKDSPLAATGAPAPRWLQGAARVECRRTVAELEPAGLLTRLDRNLVALYCQAWARCAT